MSTKAIVGITSRCSDQEVQWLMDFIKGTFWQVVLNVKFLPITNRNTLEWEDRVRQCSVGILYHTKRHGRLNIVDIDGALYNEELKSLCRILGKSKVLVVLDDVDCSDSEKWRILDGQPSLKNLSSQLLLFPEKGKTEEALKKIPEFLNAFDYNTAARNLHPNTNNSTETSNTVKLVAQNAFSKMISYVPGFKSEKSDEMSSASRQNLHQRQILPSIITSKLKIGIFSRSAQSNYDWLVDSLRTMSRSIEVHEVYITNSYTGFYCEISQCSFAILYHTQKQGRLNITDVTDSLYDEELRDLSKCLGKENVIVVVDDLKKTNPSEKMRILEGQPSIRRLARDLYLFSDKKKNTDSLEEIKQIILKKTTTCNNMKTDLERYNSNYTPEENRSESLGKDRSLQRSVSESSSSRQHQGPGYRPQVSSSNYSTNFHSLQDYGVQPSASGIHPNVGSLHDHSDESEGPEAKKPNLERNFLEQINFQQFCISVDEQLEAFKKLCGLEPIIRDVFLKMKTEIPKMLQDKDKIINNQKLAVTTLTKELDFKEQMIQSKDNTIREMQSEQEKKTCEITKLRNQMESLEIQGKEKEKDLQAQIDTMTSENKRLKENQEQFETLKLNFENIEKEILKLKEELEKEKREHAETINDILEGKKNCEQVTL